MSAPETAYDLILKGGRVIDPGQGLDAVVDVAFAEGKVAAIGPHLPGSARTVRDVAGRIVVPGIIDLHTHVYWGATSLSVEAEPIARRSATTTFLDAGSAGAGNFHGMKRFIIEASPLKILAYLNISFAGIFGFSRSLMVGECGDLRLLDSRECLRVARAHPEHILGIKVRIGKVAGDASGLTPLKMAIEVAEELNLPVMAHIDFPPPTREDVLAILRPGDILTHCFRPFPNAPVDREGKVRQTMVEARKRGIWFDIGHGMGAFSFGAAEASIKDGFLPDVISSDVHELSVDGPAFDNLVTMSKLLCLGMELGDVVKAATTTPALILQRPDLGNLRPGSAGDASVLTLREGEFPYVDVLGEQRIGDRRLFADAVVLNGQVWHEAA